MRGAAAARADALGAIGIPIITAIAITASVGVEGGCMSDVAAVDETAAVGTCCYSMILRPLSRRTH
jgi:hypothetical protein